MSTDKTLADVQPGGRMRLGDGPTIEKQARELLAAEHRKCDRNTEADLVLAGDVTVLGQIALNAIIAALSAQPSPGGQDAHEMADALERIAAGALSDYEGVDADELHILRCAKLIRDLAARQPVGEHVEGDDFLAGICVALQCVTAQDSGVLWAEIVRAAGVDDLLQYATFIEPAEWDLAGFRTYASTELGRRQPRNKASKQAKRPPAQAVDLGQFRRPIEEWRSDMEQWVEGHGDYDGVFAKDIAEANRLLALIDSHSAGGHP
ncbi:hypothetical protein [Stenotrophomonas geniculata]|uniref:hypothetical protein n=1 Tax=Stenotrophomonas geniculata TaxID=86188 RepID=UPI003D95882B